MSPGTPLLWDAGYAASYPDLDFLVAAVLVGRVVSKPAPGKVCLDFGTKALASEMPQPRISLLDIGGYRIAGHNEEHLVIEPDDPGRFRVGGRRLRRPDSHLPDGGEIRDRQRHRGQPMHG